MATAYAWLGNSRQFDDCCAQFRNSTEVHSDHAWWSQVIADEADWFGAGHRGKEHEQRKCRHVHRRSRPRKECYSNSCDDDRGCDIQPEDEWVHGFVVSFPVPVRKALAHSFANLVPAE